jgi:hypothetical protein
MERDLLTLAETFHEQVKDLDRLHSTLDTAAFTRLWANGKSAWAFHLNDGGWLWESRPITSAEQTTVTTAIHPYGLALIMSAFDIAVSNKAEIPQSYEVQIQSFVRDVIATNPQIGTIIAKALLQEDIVAEFETT